MAKYSINLRNAFARTKKTVKRGYKKLRDAVLKRLFPRYFQRLAEYRYYAKKYTKDVIKGITINTVGTKQAKNWNDTQLKTVYKYLKRGKTQLARRALSALFVSQGKKILNQYYEADRQLRKIIDGYRKLKNDLSGVVKKRIDIKYWTVFVIRY